MIHIRLPEAEVRRLDELFRTTGDVKLRHRLQIVLMAHRGRRCADIAADTGTSLRSVHRWLNAYLERGLDALRPRTAPGAKPKLTDDLAPLLQHWVRGGPNSVGLDRANWTYAELADHLFQARGIRVRKSALQVFCRKHGIRPYRPTYRFLRGDAAKQEKAADELVGLKRGLSTANSSC